MKKRILILAAALLCLLSTGVLAAGGTSQKVDLWNGTVSMPASIISQDGEQYYEISSCSELAYVAQMGGSWLNQNYRLVADLDLGERSWTPSVPKRPPIPASLMATVTVFPDCTSLPQEVSPVCSVPCRTLRFSD